MKPLVGLRASDTARGRALQEFEIGRLRDWCAANEEPWGPRWTQDEDPVIQRQPVPAGRP